MPPSSTSKLLDKLIFLPKCATSRLQPLDAGIIRVLECKYKKLLMKYVVSQMDEGKKPTEIRQDVNIAKAIHWFLLAWKDVLTDAIV